MELSLNILSLLNTDMSKTFMIGLAYNSVGVNWNTLNRTSPDRTIRNHSRIGNLGVNEGVFSPSRGKTSSLSRWTGNIEPSDTSVHGYATQGTNSDLSCIEKVVVKIVLSETVADLDPSIWVNLANSVLSKTPKFISLRLPAVDATNIRNLDFAPSTRAKSLGGRKKDNFSPSRLGYTHDFETTRKTTAYRNHIKNSRLETREVFDWETRNIPHTLQKDLVTTLNDDPLT